MFVHARLYTDTDAGQCSGQMSLCLCVSGDSVWLSAVVVSLAEARGPVLAS